MPVNPRSDEAEHQRQHLKKNFRIANHPAGDPQQGDETWC